MAASSRAGVPPFWHALPARAVAAGLDVDLSTGLSSPEAARRLAEYGPNRLAAARREPAWRSFMRQFQDLLIVILLIAAAVSLVVSREWETPVAIVVVVLLNATIGFEESRPHQPARPPTASGSGLEATNDSLMPWNRPRVG